MDEAFERAQEDAEREVKEETRKKCSEMLRFFLANQMMIFEAAPSWVNQRENIVNAFQNGIILLERYDSYKPEIRSTIDAQASRNLDTYWDFYQDLLERQENIGNN